MTSATASIPGYAQGAQETRDPIGALGAAADVVKDVGIRQVDGATHALVRMDAAARSRVSGYVHGNPWKTLAGVGAAGLVVRMLLARHRQP